MKYLPEAGTERWRIDMNALEAHLLARSLEHLAAGYRLKMEDLPLALQEYWRGRISAASDGDELKDEQRQLEEERLAWRGERLTLIEKWVKAYQDLGVGAAWSLALSREELEEFLVILNDRRLMLAAEHELEDVLMETPPDEIVDLKVIEVLVEMDILAKFQWSCLEALHPGEDLNGQEE